ncbi:ATP-binding protein [Actinomadura sp. 9N407]|uniref:ATP-binding protein n=1 Tax=Actinomadura sp. 9N407 TaxID=3375154 RepID=UPI003794093E
MRTLGTISLPGVTRSAPEARAFVRLMAGTHLGLERDVLGDIELCVDELIANACEHTASGRDGKVAVVLEVGRETGREVLRLKVIDDGGANGKPHVAEGCGEDGRGLRLVEALSLGWGVDQAWNGTEVWADFPARPRALERCEPSWQLAAEG